MSLLAGTALLCSTMPALNCSHVNQQVGPTKWPLNRADYLINRRIKWFDWTATRKNWQHLLLMSLQFSPKTCQFSIFKLTKYVSSFWILPHHWIAVVKLNSWSDIRRTRPTEWVRTDLFLNSQLDLLPCISHLAGSYYLIAHLHTTRQLFIMWLILKVKVFIKFRHQIYHSILIRLC